MRYVTIKKMLYLAETMIGVVFLTAAVTLIRDAAGDVDAIVELFPGVVLLVVGFVCLLFGLETFYFRDDPDIWR